MTLIELISMCASLAATCVLAGAMVYQRQLTHRERMRELDLEERELELEAGEADDETKQLGAGE